MIRSKLRYALKLKCPYCGSEPLLESWFKLATGCANCQINYSIDESHYSGASQLIAFPLASVLGLAEGALIWWVFKIDTLLVAMISFFSMVIFLLLIWPIAIAMWIWLDHYLRPVALNVQKNPAINQVIDQVINPIINQNINSETKP